MTKHLYRTLTWPEVREAAEKRTVIVIPVAAIEQHGRHLPIHTDNVRVEHEKGKAFAECAIQNLVAFAREFREPKVAADVDLNHSNPNL